MTGAVRSNSPRSRDFTLSTGAIPRKRFPAKSVPGELLWVAPVSTKCNTLFMARLKNHGKKETKKTPILRQLALAKHISENMGKCGPDGKRLTMGRAMLDVGYSPSYAKASLIQSTSSWQTLMENTFPDDLISQKLTEHMNAKQIRQMYFASKLKDSEIKKVVEDEGFRFISTKRFMASAVVFFAAPDFLSQEKALEKILKLKNKYGDITVRHRFGELGDAELEREIAREVSAALGTLAGEEEA